MKPEGPRYSKDSLHPPAPGTADHADRPVRHPPPNPRPGATRNAHMPGGVDVLLKRTGGGGGGRAKRSAQTRSRVKHQSGAPGCPRGGMGSSCPIRPSLSVSFLEPSFWEAQFPTWSAEGMKGVPGPEAEKREAGSTPPPTPRSWGQRARRPHRCSSRSPPNPTFADKDHFRIQWLRPARPICTGQSQSQRRGHEESPARGRGPENRAP